MIDEAESKLIDAGYKPYYLYRQKHQLGGLENVGFFRDDSLCIFNVDSMEETSSIIAVGAGAISKRVPDRIILDTTIPVVTSLTNTGYGFDYIIPLIPYLPPTIIKHSLYFQYFLAFQVYFEFFCFHHQ